MSEETKKMHNQEDVIPGAEQDKIAKVAEDKKDDKTPLTTGTGSLPAVPRSESLIIKKEEE